MKDKWTLEYEYLQDEVYDESSKSLKMKKPKKSWKEAKSTRESKRNKGFNKKHSNR
jgi:hypothetical protein